jgi:ATP-dependent Clp protease adaptor protein ClpS
MTEILIKEKTLSKKEVVKDNDLVIYNDEVNTFEHVINSLVKVCKHETIQAEQCTWIIHYNGKCAVKKGEFNKLKPMKDALCERGIDAKIH